MSDNKPKQQMLVMVPRRLVITTTAAFIGMFIMMVASFQFAYWIDSRSNQRLCSITRLFNKAYEENPPSTQLGKDIQTEMENLQRFNKCKKT